MEIDDLLGRFVPTQFQIDQPILELWILGVHQALFDQFEKTAHAGFGLALIMAQLFEAFAVTLPPAGRFLDVVFEKVRQPLGLQHAFRDFANDNAVQLVHANANALAGAGALLLLPGAGIIGIGAALAAVLDQGGAAMAATSETGQKRRTIDDARRQFLRAATLQKALNLVEEGLINDRRDSDLHPLRGRTRRCVTAVCPVEVVFADVCRAVQNFMDSARREKTAATQNPAIGHIRRNRLDPDRAAVLSCRHRKDLADNRRLILIDAKNFLVLVTAPIGRLELIAEGNSGAVPVALPGVLAHGAMHMLGVFARLMLIEDVE